MDRREFICAGTLVGGSILAGCTGSGRSSESGVELSDINVNTQGGSTTGIFEVTNPSDEEASGEISASVDIGTDGIYGKYTNETSVSLESEESEEVELELIDRSELDSVEQDELSEGYFVMRAYIDDEEVYEEEFGEQPSQHVSFRVLYAGGWSGAIGSEGRTRNVGGQGSDHLSVDDGSRIISGNAQKRDGGQGRLVTQILVDGEVIAEESTTENYGVAQVATESDKSPISNPTEPDEIDTKDSSDDSDRIGGDGSDSAGAGESVGSSDGSGLDPEEEDRVRRLVDDALEDAEEYERRDDDDQDEE